MCRDVCPCSRDCPDRQPNCHTINCPHGWYEWNERKLKGQAMEFERKVAMYDEVRYIRDAVDKHKRRR